MLQIEQAKNVLVLAPHTDDGELGAGGTIAKLTEGGAKVFYAAFSTAEQSVPEGFEKDILKREVRAATQELGIPEERLFVYNYEVRKLNYARQEILEDLIVLRRNIDFDLILMPSLNDVHQDHMTVANEGLRAFKNKTILGYELIWNNLKFDIQCFVFLEDRHVEHKIKALSHYQSQGHRVYMSDAFIRSLAMTRGVQIGTSYAEAFEVIRLVFQ